MLFLCILHPLLQSEEFKYLFMVYCVLYLIVICYPVCSQEAFGYSFFPDTVESETYHSVSFPVLSWFSFLCVYVGDVGGDQDEESSFSGSLYVESGCVTYCSAAVKGTRHFSLPVFQHSLVACSCDQGHTCSKLMSHIYLATSTKII